MMKETQNNELLSNLAAEESVSINGGCGCGGYSRPVIYRHHRPVSYHYDSYEYSRPIHRRYRYTSYGYGYGGRRYNCY